MAADVPCLRAPAFLGVHTITLNQTTHIDGGGLRLWAGAAHHDEPTTDAAAELLRELEQRYASQALGDGLAERAERVSSVGASGSRRIGGPFLRAALGASDDFKHVWLSARLAESHAVGARLAEAHTSSEIHFVGAYRLRVLRVELVEADAADELSAREGIRVSVAVDRVAAGPPPAAATLALPASGETAEAWLSTQGARALSLVGEAAASSAPEPPRPGSFLPQISDAADAASSTPPELSLSLHVVPQPDEAGGEDGGFGWPTTGWTVSLDAVLLGGDDEAHASVPLLPECAPTTLRLGRYAVRVLRCAAHFAREADAVVASDYPLLLLHAQLAITAAGEDTRSEAQSLGDGLEALLGE